MNYEQLQATIGRWLKRTDLSASIPDFIVLAEARLNRNLRVRQMESNATIALTNNSGALPSDWLEFIGQPKSTHPLSFVTRDQFKSLKSGDFYTIQGGNIYAFATSVTCDYYARIPAIAIGQNWLLTEAPDVYLYASLIESAPYLRDDARIAIWRDLLARAITDMTSADMTAKYSGAPLEIK